MEGGCRKGAWREERMDRAAGEEVERRVGRERGYLRGM
jgi:hypothetical protein